MQILQPFEKLHQITLDLGLAEVNRRVLQETGKVMFHIRSDHVQAHLLLSAVFR